MAGFGGEGKGKKRAREVRDKGAREVREGRGRLQGCFRPLIKYAKPTQLWNVWLSKLSNQNHAAFFAAKSVGANEFAYFLFSLFCVRK